MIRNINDLPLEVLCQILLHLSVKNSFKFITSNRILFNYLWKEFYNKKHFNVKSDKMISKELIKHIHKVAINKTTNINLNVFPNLNTIVLNTMPWYLTVIPWQINIPKTVKTIIFGNFSARHIMPLNYFDSNNTIRHIEIYCKSKYFVCQKDDVRNHDLIISSNNSKSCNIFMCNNCDKLCNSIKNTYTFNNGIIDMKITIIHEKKVTPVNIKFLRNDVNQLSKLLINAKALPNISAKESLFNFKATKILINAQNKVSVIICVSRKWIVNSIYTPRQTIINTHTKKAITIALYLRELLKLEKIIKININGEHDIIPEISQIYEYLDLINEHFPLDIDIELNIKHIKLIFNLYKVCKKLLEHNKPKHQIDLWACYIKQLNDIFNVY